MDEQKFPCGNRLIFDQDDWDRIHSTEAGRNCPKFHYCDRWINPAKKYGSFEELDETRARNGGRLFPHDIPESIPG